MVLERTRCSGNKAGFCVYPADRSWRWGKRWRVGKRHRWLSHCPGEGRKVMGILYNTQKVLSRRQHQTKLSICHQQTARVHGHDYDNDKLLACINHSLKKRHTLNRSMLWPRLYSARLKSHHQIPTSPLQTAYTLWVRIQPKELQLPDKEISEKARLFFLSAHSLCFPQAIWTLVGE